MMPLPPDPLSLEHGASLRAVDHRRLTAFGSAADGGYPELWRGSGSGHFLEAKMVVEWKTIGKP